MNTVPTEESEVVAAMRHALSPEPDFTSPWLEALDAAVRGGRRRRARARTASVGLVAAAVTGISVLAAQIPSGSAGSQELQVGVAPVVAGTEAAKPLVPPVASETPEPFPDEASARAAKHEAVGQVVSRVATMVAQWGGAKSSAPVVKQAPDDPQVWWLQATVEAALPAGRFTVAAFYEEGDTLAMHGTSCSAGAGDAKPCTVLLSTGQAGAWSATYPEQGARAVLTYAARAEDDQTLVVVVDNYVETAAGKVVGPTWQTAGITLPGIDAVLVKTGALLH